MKQQIYRRFRINLFDLLIVLWGCGMLPLWGLGLYYSFKEGPLLVQSLVMALAALGVALCFIAAPLLRLRKGIAAAGLIFAAGFTLAHLLYNANEPAILYSGLVFALIFFWLPGVLLFLSALPPYQTRFFTNTATVINPSVWLLLVVGIGLFLLLLGGLYGFGFSA